MVSVELRTELRDQGLAVAVLRRLGATPIIQLRCVDTYFNVPSGTLKLRQAHAEPTEFVFYDRKPTVSPRLCTFTIYSHATGLERFGTQPMPILATVTKVRSVYMLGNVRIHIDAVDDLGTFLELEALVSRDCTVKRCNDEIAAVRRWLGSDARPGRGCMGLLMGEPVSVRYADLVLAAQR